MRSADDTAKGFEGPKIALVALATVALLAAGWFLSGNKSKQHAIPAPLTIELSETRNENGLLFAPNESVPFTGIVVEHYENGTMKSKTQVKEGKIHGLSEGWHKNGQLQVKESFEHGLAHGLREKWRSDGSKESEGTIQKGQFEGTFRKWHPNGQLAEEMEMAEGVAHGEATSWHEDGSLKAQVTLDKGKVIKQEFFEQAATQ